MQIFRHNHPKTFKFLTENLLLPPNASFGPFPDLSGLLSVIVSPSSDDQKYILIPTILEILSTFYKHQDAVYTLNEYISEQFPEYDEQSHEALLR